MKDVLRTICLMVLGCAAPWLAASAADSGCVLGKLAELPINMNGHQATINGQINGAPAAFEVSSGSFWSMLSLAAVRQYGLTLKQRTESDGPAPIYDASGIGYAGITRVKKLNVFGGDIRNIDFLVLPTDVADGNAGMIGQNLLRFADVEYDFGHSVMRLFRIRNCHGKSLAYWLKPGDSYSVLDLRSTDDANSHSIVMGFLNGQEVRIELDSGSSRSIVTLQAARKAGLLPDSPGVEAAGDLGGVGRKRNKLYIGTFDSFRIGDEEVHKARLLFGLDFNRYDVLLGRDFFLSHHLLVSNQQLKLYMSYNGGPVFNPRHSQSASADPAETPLEPTDAAGFAARAAVFEARNTPAQALADLSRACELAPDDADYRFRRARLRERVGQLQPALDDLDHALSLEPDHLDALLLRAELYQKLEKTNLALADLQHAARIANPAAEQRLEIADSFLSLKHLKESLPLYDRWIALHASDSRLPSVLGSRCQVRALLDVEIDHALKDCKEAANRKPDSAAIRSSLGLAYLRKGNWGDAIESFDAALGKQPDSAWSLYGRGIAKLRSGDQTGGQADIAAAKASSAATVEEAVSYGITP